MEFHIMRGMNKLPAAKRAQVLSMLCEGSSMQSTARVCDVAFNSIVKLLADAGKACEAFHDKTVRGVQSKRVQCDEIWSFVYAKQKNVATAKAAPQGAGDCWTWTALDADTKLIVAYAVGGRDASYANAFMQDVADRLATRVQMTTDGHKAYLDAVEGAFGADIDYGMLIKTYGEPVGALGRYSPGECTGAEKKRVEGRPDPKHISTSYAERQNLTMRMSMRRFTRLTNAFSKKVENHEHMVRLYAVWYNFVKMHRTLKCSPAMAAGISATLWSMDDIVKLIDAQAEAPKPRGPYKTKARLAAENSN
jgi:IS1 family transposase